MGRKIEFDLEKALDRAMHEFWKKGYSNTSLRDLLKVMDIGESSFYHLFGGKKLLYLQCVQRYNQEVSGPRIEALEKASTAAKGARSFFKIILDDLEDQKTPRLCLMAGSLGPDVLIERDIEEYVLATMHQFEEIFFNRFEKGKKQGDLPPKFDSRVAAQVFVTYLQGFFRVVHVLKTRKEMERQVHALMVGLGLG